MYDAMCVVFKKEKNWEIVKNVNVVKKNLLSKKFQYKKKGSIHVQVKMSRTSASSNNISYRTK